METINTQIDNNIGITGSTDSKELIGTTGSIDSKELPPTKIIGVDMKLTLNTHHYDYKLRHYVRKLLDKSTAKLTFEETIESIKKISLELRYCRSCDVNRSLDLMLLDRRGNYDSTNDVNAEEILVKVWANVESWDNTGKVLFLEQIADINHGSCSQGRATRLLQLL